jgi:virginiamycin B lyase
LSAALRWGLRAVAALATLATFGGLSCTPGDEPRPFVEFSEYSIETPGAVPGGIVAGQGDEMWFVEGQAPILGRIGTDGTITEFVLETSTDGYRDVIQDSEGSLWLSNARSPNLTRWEVDETLTVFPLGDLTAAYLTFGREGNVWFSTFGPEIGTLDRSGTVETYAVLNPPETIVTYGITLGPLGEIWTTSSWGTSYVGEAREAPNTTEAAVVGELVLTRTPTYNGLPRLMTTAPDGTMWFTNYQGDKITRLSANGNMLDFVLPQAATLPNAITTDTDGNIWATSNSNHIIGMTPSGEFTLYPIPTPDCKPAGIAEGPDGNIWFTEGATGKIGVLRFR